MSGSRIWSATAGVEGSPNVVLIHGSLDRSAGLLKLSRRLDHRYFVTRYDRRGYGRSTPCDGPFGVDEQLEDLIELIDRLESIERVVLVGHSYGGNIALACVDRHPDLIAGVVTYESPLSWESWWPGQSAAADAMAWVADPAEAAEQFMRRLIGEERWERLSASTRQARRDEGPAMVGELVDLRSRPAWNAERIGVPVLAVHGELGSPHHRLAMRLLGERLVDVEVGILPDARHFGPNTHPDAMGELVVDFIERRVQIGSVST